MSLSNPTREFLLENFTKPRLQDHCRQLGITRGLHVTKEELIRLILDKHEATNSSSVLDSEDTSMNVLNNQIQSLISEFRDIKEKLAMKDIEIDDLYSKVRIANETINHLQDKIVTLENRIGEESDQGREGDTNSGSPETPRTPKHTLLLGDENLSYVKPSDLGKQCSIRTISDADIHVFRAWISKKLTWTPSDCICYVGKADLLDNTTPAVILDNLSLLISDLKNVNPDMVISICKLVPMLSPDDIQARVNELNDELVKWGQMNSINVISSDLPFKLANGEIDDMCYETEDSIPGPRLNRLGVVRLLDTITKLCQNFNLCDDWSKTRRCHSFLDSSFLGNQNRASGHSNDNRHRYQSDWGNRQFSVLEPFRNRNTPHSQPTRNMSNRDGYRNNDHDRRNFNTGNRGCYNCGEFNHHYSMCRYDHQIRCGFCSGFGHKSRLCNRYNHH